MPTKIAEFLACGRPVVVNKGLGDMDQFIEEFDAGVVLDGTSSNLIEGAKKLASLLSDRDTPIRCRTLAEKYFSADVGASKYLELYSKISKLKT
jgi:glycosyltransferase involved in cell wall biosynthesis